MRQEQILGKEVVTGSVDLTEVSFSFSSDTELAQYGEAIRTELGNKEKWLAERAEEFVANRVQIEEAVVAGVLPEATLEAVWRWRSAQEETARERLLKIRDLLADNVEVLRAAAEARLARFLPDWSPRELRVVFTTDESADYRFDEGVVYVSLPHQLKISDVLQDVEQGLAHELFHAWMQEGRVDEDIETVEQLKDSIRFRILDEGIAVLVSGQSLERHHEAQGRNYDEYRKEAFEVFAGLRQADDFAELEESEENGFRDMGYFYVIGNEFAKKILARVGKDKFRELIPVFKKEPKRFFEEAMV
ncbi:MAG: hypothetical protein COU11_02085 [Candidatus Harrisonbacteria bacterium CG10_big_fil_rev_8_21_14_0_10_49_15]|uniref:DUF2268 domain-containing protein n=1 Tax=Candidatus Harrisonbacteria bacterium CG10_big_fil_rev_8_21_14_0_10_49_15 TaxID=1974587 RepID=A0A2H0UKR2_9BACT|nr:MAG: hypothetical protein COU11_02085 [Candidatus Harrisonbacteria bacterium CG10_big_fil_rev_8_21_14_0_10_49_15]